ncbi:MAG: hypothetical protein K5647_00570 [Clostridiales bacterium]|nr:hypothetical protein [Clostridiales bacterium]
MKKLFIYYSLSGNGDLVAKRLSELGYDLRKVETAKKMPESFFLRILAGGFAAGIGKKEKLKGYDPDVAGYDEIAIGSPVWNGRISSPVNTVLAKTNLSGRKLSFILYAGGGEAPKAVARLEKEFPGSRVRVLKEPLKYPEELDKLDI